MSEEQHCSEEDAIQKCIDYLLIEKKQKIVKDNFEVTMLTKEQIFYIPTQKYLFLMPTKIFWILSYTEVRSNSCSCTLNINSHPIRRFGQDEGNSDWLRIMVFTNSFRRWFWWKIYKFTCSPWERENVLIDFSFWRCS